MREEGNDFLNLLDEIYQGEKKSAPTQPSPQPQYKDLWEEDEYDEDEEWGFTDLDEDSTISVVPDEMPTNLNDAFTREESLPVIEETQEDISGSYLDYVDDNYDDDEEELSALLNNLASEESFNEDEEDYNVQEEPSNESYLDYVDDNDDDDEEELSELLNNLSSEEGFEIADDVQEVEYDFDSNNEESYLDYVDDNDDDDEEEIDQPSIEEQFLASVGEEGEEPKSFAEKLQKKTREDIEKEAPEEELDDAEPKPKKKKSFSDKFKEFVAKAKAEIGGGDEESAPIEEEEELEEEVVEEESEESPKKDKKSKKFALPIPKIKGKKKLLLLALPILLIIFLFMFLRSGLAGETVQSLPDVGSTLFNNFSYKDGVASGTITNTGEVIAKVNPVFETYALDIGLNPKSWFSLEKIGSCTGELVEVPIGESIDVSVPCEIDGMHKNVVGKVEF